MAERHPCGEVLEVANGVIFLIGYQPMEDPDKPHLIVSNIDPTQDYEGAMREKFLLCPDFLEDQEHNGE